MGADAAFRHAVRTAGFTAAGSSYVWATNGTTGPPASLSLLLDLHSRVLGGSLLDANAAGKWRDMQVYVTGHRPPPASEVSALMAELEARWQSLEFAELHPVVQAALAHFELVSVHPFLDGNGRTARLLSSHLLMRAGYPPLNVRLEDRPRYFEALTLAHPSKGGCTRLLIDLFSDRVAELQAELAYSLPAVPDEDTVEAVSVRADGELQQADAGRPELVAEVQETSVGFSVP